MNKKVIALILSCVMLVSASPAVAAEDTPVKPTIEEILNDYHQKAFEARSAEDAGETTTYSNRSGGKTLEQETVDTLNAAGYEAYNVTASNYDALEAELNTDFASMGLDPNSSYIIVISGEDTNNANQTRSYGDNLITPTPCPGEDGGSSLFEYIYGGVTYTMRYVTVTCTDQSTLSRQLHFGVDRNANSSIWGTIFDAGFSFTIDTITKVPITTFAHILNDAFGSALPTAESYEGFMITGCTTWTLEYIEVYNFNEARWVQAQFSEYAVTSWEPLHYTYDATTMTHLRTDGPMITFNTYSEYFNDKEYRKELAAEFYQMGTRLMDYTDDIIISLTNLSGEPFYFDNEEFEFVQEHWSYDEPSFYG